MSYFLTALHFTFFKLIYRTSVQYDLFSTEKPLISQFQTKHISTNLPLCKFEEIESESKNEQKWSKKIVKTTGLSSWSSGNFSIFH